MAAQASPEDEYKQKLAQISRTCAAKHYSIGEYLSGAQMHLWAREQYNKVVEFDPDHEGARRKLGYKKGDSGWENDPTAKIDVNKKKDAEADKVRKAYAEKMDAAGKDIARLWSELAAFCRKNNMAKETVEAFRKAVEYDPTNAIARKELGYEKDAKGIWVSKSERELRKEMKDGIGKAPSGAVSTEQTEVEKGMGEKHSKREAPHFLMESPHLKDAELGDLLQHAEHTYAMYHKIVGDGGDLFGGNKMNHVILKDKPQHLKFVDAFDSGSPAQKDLARKSAGLMGIGRSEVFQGSMPVATLQDWVVHSVAQALSEIFVGGKNLWIHEGTAYYFTKLMKESAASSCVDLAGTSPGSGEAKNLQDPANWTVIVKVWVREGKDANIDKVLKCTSLADFNGADSVKAWSMIEFLLAEHHDKFLELCQALKKGANIEEGLKAVWGWSTTDLDQRWKQYVRNSY